LFGSCNPPGLHDFSWQAPCSFSWFQDSLTASPLAGLSIGPPAGNGAEMQFAFAPFQAPELADLNRV
jgi:hypothetical protein